MSVRVQEGTIVLRNWSERLGFAESEVSFSSLDELFELCLRIQSASLVDRIIIRGADTGGAVRSVAFTFLSVSRPEDAA